LAHEVEMEPMMFVNPTPLTKLAYLDAEARELLGNLNAQQWREICHEFKPRIYTVGRKTFVPGFELVRILHQLLQKQAEEEMLRGADDA
jgi:hypothetical protein